jgi:apolipoprotein N-acyltransferase
MSPRHVALACVSGVLYGLALADESFSWIGWICLAPLFAISTRVRPGAATLLGVAWAVAATAALSSWLPGALEGYFGLARGPALLGWLAAALLVNGPPYGLLCAWLSWAARRRPLGPLGVGLGWLAAEYLRAHGPIPDPYAPLAASQLGTAWVQGADLVGALGVGALVACGNALLAATVTPSLRGAAPRRELLLALGVLALFWIYGDSQLAHDFADGDSIRVALVQPGVAAGGGPRAQELALERELELSAAAARNRPDLVFWPEYAIDFYLREPSAARERVLAASRALGADLVLGGPHYRYAEPSPHYHTSVFLLRDGRVTGRYDKLRLVPFAEYAPLGGLLRAGSVEYEPGSSARLLEASRVRIGAFLCAEVLFPEIARELARSGAGVLVNPSNDGWFGSAGAASLQLRSAALRAIENRRPLVRPTTSGYSAVLDPLGRVLARGDLGVPAVIEAEISASHVITSYQRFGDVPALCAVTLAALVTLWTRRSRVWRRRNSA